MTAILRNKGFWAGIWAMATILHTPVNALSAEPESKNAQPIAEVEELLTEAGKQYTAGHYDQSIEISKRALALSEKVRGTEHPDNAYALKILASNYVSQGKYKDAELLMQRGLAGKARAGVKDEIYAEMLFRLGSIYYYTGINDLAELNFLASLSLQEERHGPSSKVVASQLTSLALLYIEMGNFPKAETILNRVLKIDEANRDTETFSHANALNSLGNVYWYTRDFAKAEAMYMQGLATSERVSGPDHPDTGLFVMNIGILRANTGKYGEAVPYLERALSINEKSLGIEHRDTVTVRKNLAMIKAAQGNYNDALELTLKELSIEERTQGKQSRTLAETYRGIGELYADMKNFDRSEFFYRRSLSTWTNMMQRHPDVSDTLGALATLKWAANKTSEASTLFQAAASVRQEDANRLLWSISESRKQVYLQQVSRDTHRAVSFSLASPNPTSIALGLNSVLLYKGRVLDETSNSIVRLRRNMQPADQKIFDQLTSVANELSKSIYQGPGSLSEKGYKKKLQDLVQEKDSMEAALSKRSANFRREASAVTVESIRREVPADAALIEWFRYVSFDPHARRFAPESEQTERVRYAAYIIKRHSAPVVLDIADAETLEAAVSQFRSALSDPTQTNFAIRAAPLSRLIDGAIQPHIKDVSHLLISPDGALNLVSMSALLDRNNNFYIKRFDITYLTSGRDLLQKDPRPPRQPAVIVASPTFGALPETRTQSAAIRSALTSDEIADSGAFASEKDRGGIRFRSLANTALEASEIQNILGNIASTILIGNFATEENVKALRGPTILHIASHGFFLSKNELSAVADKRMGATINEESTDDALIRAGIALAGANNRASGQNNDGILTALEMAQLDLDGTQLVVLSACDGATGDIRNGEGVYGLRRAIALAGARSQISSLWRVSDETTRSLMTDLYRRLQDGKGPSAAMRAVQLNLLATPKYSHPYFWASFVAIGDWKPLSVLH